MKILFVANHNELSDTKKSKTMVILDALSKIYEDIYTYSSSPIVPSPKNHISNNKILKDEDWDIVIIQDNANLQFIAKQIKKKPLVFLCNSNSIQDQYIDLPNLYKIILTDDDISIKFDLPTNMISRINTNSISSWNIKTRGPIGSSAKVLYIVADTDISLNTTRILIKIFNANPHISFTIAADLNVIPIISALINENIVLTKTPKSLKRLFQNHNLIITSKETAISALLSNIPVIVVGSNGLGGHVNESNLPDFIKTQFKGRIGGSIDEPIPEQLLDFEINHTLEILQKLPHEKANIRSIALDLLKNRINNNWIASFCEQIENCTNLYFRLSAKSPRLLLKPRLAHHIQLSNLKIKEDDYIALVNKVSGKVLGVLGTDETSILNSCNGRSTIKEIARTNTEYSENDIDRFILGLWKTRVLVFN